MLKTTFTWFTGSDISKEHGDIKVNQVYCWVITADNKVILVSKDGTKWQFPGGHPEAGEDLFQACQRELEEEIGLDISTLSSKPRFFGYYLVSEPNQAGDALVNILQVRMCLKLNQKASELSLLPHEKVTEKMTERINHITPFSIDEVLQKTPWLKDSPELNTFLQL